MNSWTKKAVAWALCLFFLFGVTISRYSDVLCISDNGRVKIESICQPGYGEIVDCCFLATSTNAYDNQDDCDDCLDLSVGGPTWLRKTIESVNSPMHIASLSSLSVSPCFDHNSSKYSRFAVADSFRGQNHLALLISTTVLIC
jgi:hypothetical protein